MIPLPTIDQRDEQLLRKVENAFLKSGFAGLASVGISVKQRRVVLDGAVPTYFLKQMAQAIAAGVSGVESVLNPLQVREEVNRHVGNQENIG